MLEVPEWVIQEMHQRVQSDYPNESTGAVLHRKGRPGELFDHEYRVVGMHNNAKDPRNNYEWSAKQQELLFETMERTDMDLHIIYHSHPETDPTPSETDRLAAWYAGVHYIIFSSAVGDGVPWFESWLCTIPGKLEPEEVRLR